MNILEYAMKMEKDGEDLYREMARSTGDPGLKKILTMLADDEVKHYKIFEGMRKMAEPKMMETRVLSDARNIFTNMDPAGASDETGHIDMYKKALDIEKKSREFYEDKAKETGSPEEKDLFLKIADEEKKHYFLLENLIQFVNRPQQWLEDAEFNHLEDY
ncbi:MAG: ferritin family protein [Candidatus Aminicenantes bacterium]